MSGRPTFFGGSRPSDAQERGAEGGFGSGFGGTGIRLGESTPPGFDPIWGTLGAPGGQGMQDWASQNQEEDVEGVPVDVEIFGDGFQVSGTIRTGQFGRLSDWVNMQSGFIQVRDAWHVHLGQTTAPNADERKGTLFVRLDQVVLIAERTAARAAQPGAPVVQKQKRKSSIVTHGYTIRGNLFLHAYGSMKQFLESPDPHFLPLTDLAVHWINDSTLTARFPFAMVNREQIVTLLDETTLPAADSPAGASEDGLAQREWGAA